MIVLGIDPGTACLGMAHVDIDGQPRVVQCSTLRQPATSHDDRIHAIAGAVSDALDGVSLVVVEDQSGAQVGHWRRGTTNASASLVRDVVGLVKGLAYSRGIDVVTVTPQRAKMAVGARANATKAAVQQCVRRLVADVPSRVSEHAIDAVAIAIAGGKQQTCNTSNPKASCSQKRNSRPSSRSTRTRSTSE